MRRGLPDLLRVAGCRSWTASLLPALVGTTLPFWLRPPGFSFRWTAAVAFLAATTLVHAGFSLLRARFDHRRAHGWRRSHLLGLAALCIGVASLLGACIDSRLTLHAGVPSYIFAVYGSAVLFAGVLYVVPPFSFHRRAGGETVVCAALGLMPLLGAYLVQVGDITRRVYLASLPLVAATALWVWTGELLTRARDEQEGRQTLVVLFGPGVSGRLIPIALSLFFLATVLLAVLTSSVAPWTLAVVLTVGRVRTIVDTPGSDAAGATGLDRARASRAVHRATGIIIVASTAIAALRR